MGDIVETLFTGGLSNIIGAVGGGDSGGGPATNVEASSTPDIPTAAGSDTGADSAKKRKLAGRGLESTVLGTSGAATLG